VEWVDPCGWHSSLHWKSNGNEHVVEVEVEAQYGTMYGQWLIKKGIFY
jgi:uncharacterized cupin superfamily protein